MDKIDFLEKLYFHELDRKQSLESMFALPAGTIAGLFGVVGYFFTHYNFASAKAPNGLLLQFLFVSASFCAFVALMISTWWCARAVIGSEYEHLPGAKTLMTYWDELESWHSNYSRSAPVSLAETDFKLYLSESMANCCQRNWKTNLFRAQELYRTKLSIIIALFFVAILALFYYINFWAFPIIASP